MKSSKLVIALFAAALLPSLAGAVPPELSVSTDKLNLTGNNSVLVNVDSRYEFTFTNENNTRKIYDVRPENTSYLSWSKQGFNISGNSSVEVDALVNTDSPGKLNETIEIAYKYNDSDREGLQFDKNFYPEVDFFIESEYPETSISLRFFETSFNISLGETDDSVFQVRNTGNYTAYNIELSGENISYSENGFDLGAGEDKFVTLTTGIRPEVEKEFATNQTYNPVVRAEAENSGKAEQQLDVFVPYEDFTEVEENDSIAPIVKEFQEYCENTGNCTNITETVVKEKVKVKNRTPVYEANLTEQQLEALRSLSREELNNDKAIRDRILLLENLLKERTEDFNKTVNRVLNETEQAERESEKAQRLAQQAIMEEQQTQSRIQNQAIVVIGGAVGSFFLVGLVYLGLKIRERNKSYSLVE